MDNQKIGAFVAELRKAKGLSQKELADKVGVTDKAVSKWECGNGMPDISLLVPLCQILGVSINDLLNGGRIPQNEIAKKAESQVLEILLHERKRFDAKLYKVTGIVSIVFGAIWFLICAANALAVYLFPGEVGTALQYLAFYGVYGHNWADWVRFTIYILGAVLCLLEVNYGIIAIRTKRAKVMKAMIITLLVISCFTAHLPIIVLAIIALSKKSAA
jgi:transcriptional regulator with XRE-family HTH domain